MFVDRFTRFAVALALIIATMIQPAIGFAFGGKCAETGVSKPTVCTSCGCCQVKQAETTCGCCAETPSAAARDEASAPCHPQPDLLEHVDARRTVGQCLCGRASLPLHREKDRSRGASNPELRAVPNFLAPLPPLDPVRPQCSAAVVRSDHGFRSDFSQRVFCVWRI